MYERSAIVLERYMEKILKLNKEYNLKKNNDNYTELINEIENYQNVTEKELEVIQEFDDTAKEIESLQQEQAKLYKINKQLEDDRAQLFTELGEDAEVLEIKLKKIESLLDKNGKKLKEIRGEFIKFLTDFSKKQINRNKCEKARRIGEANHIGYLEKMRTEFDELDVKDVVSLKDFINFEKEHVRQEALNIMIKNGKNERVPFNHEVLKRAIKVRIEIAEKEAECYIAVYDKMKKLLAEQDSETIRLNKYQKTLRDTSVKLAFLKAQKDYIVGFLDYERMTAISGEKVHNKMMIEACNNFELDIMQIEKLYELILRETNNHSTKKGYNQLYNKTYLKNIEDKEKNFEQEVNHVNIRMGTVINSNYWRIEGIKNIYNVFQEEVSQKFNKDLSEYKIIEPEETEDIENIEELLPTVAVKEQTEKPNQYKQFQYDEQGKYKEYDYEEKQQEEKLKMYEEEEEDNEQEENQQYQYKMDDYEVEEEEEDYESEEEMIEEYENENEDDYYDEDEEEDEEDYQPVRYQKSKFSKKTTYEEPKTYYEEEDDEYEENYDTKYEPHTQEIEDDYDYEEEDDYDYEEDYKAYSSRDYGFQKNNYVTEEEEDDDEYENIYEYNYDAEEEKYRKQQLKNKTVISFDDEESIDMIIANSRKKSNTRRNNKGIFNKFFKK